eukprot:233533-Lingulodinium_polyedra.AAC.1
MEPAFVALGVRLELPCHPEAPCVSLANKPGRVEALCESAARALKEGRLSRAEAASMRGKLLYAEQQSF